jgi:Phosphatidylinositol-4-phosphate 5-Kinase
MSDMNNNKPAVTVTVDEVSSTTVTTSPRQNRLKNAVLRVTSAAGAASVAESDAAVTPSTQSGTGTDSKTSQDISSSDTSRGITSQGSESGSVQLDSVYKVAKTVQGAQKWGKKKKRVVTSLHAHFEATTAIMIGIRHTVTSIEDQYEKLTDEEKQEDVYVSDDIDKIKFKPAGGGTHNTPPHGLSVKFEFKDYAPRLFHELRRRRNISASHYLSCLSSKLPYLDFLSNSKSGEFFFFTHDRKYMIKTMPQGESKLLRKFLRKYYSHMIKYPDSFLCRLCGLHRLQMRGKKTHFIVMENVFPPELQIHRKFDLKGSKVGSK